MTGWEWSRSWEWLEGHPVPVSRVPVGSSSIRVLLAVARADRPTVRGVAADVGLSVAVVHTHLRRLRQCGHVTWEDGKKGTLRATVREVPFGG